MKKDNDGMFDKTMGSFDSAGVCELVRLFILNDLANKYGTNNIGLYRDDRLAIFKNTTGITIQKTEQRAALHQHKI